jgi:DNA-binding protein Fis
MPSLAQLHATELNELAQGYSQQAIGNNDLKNLLGLTPKECEKLAENRPLSLQELKARIEELVAHKSKKNNIEQEIHYIPSTQITDPELQHAGSLGKHALRDPQIMVLLWNTFKNQNKIATFLGVNRSSVNRRCKEYLLDR